MLLRNITDKAPFPKSISLTREIRLAPGQAVCCDELRKTPGWVSIEPLIERGLLAYEEEPKPVAQPKKESSTKSDVTAEVEQPHKPKRPPRRRKKS